MFESRSSLRRLSLAFAVMLRSAFGEVAFGVLDDEELCLYVVAMWCLHSVRGRKGLTFYSSRLSLRFTAVATLFRSPYNALLTLFLRSMCSIWEMHFTVG